MLELYDPLWDKLVSAAERAARPDRIGEPVLELSDPLWNKLDDAHRDRHIPTLLAELAASWDREAANSLLWDCLCHQETCYGATYAAIPHLLKIAEPEENGRQRLEIAAFLGFVALCSRDRHRQGRGRQLEDAVLQGLPETLEDWDRKLDCFRSLLASLDHADWRSEYEQTELLPRYKRVLAIEPVNADDLKKILSIKAEFFSALPSIRALCERSLLENVEYKEAVPYLLSGIAAADGLLSIARLLNCGDEGLFKCASCSQGYKFIRFGERIAIYAEDATRSVVRPADDKGHAGLPNVEVLTQTTVTGLEGSGGMLDAIRWRRQSGDEMRRPVRHLFLFICADPNTDWLSGSGVALDPKGFVLTGKEADGASRPLETSVPGAFAIRTNPIQTSAASLAARKSVTISM